MKQPYLLQTSPDSLILFDNGKDNFLADFHQAFSGAKLKADMKIYLPCLARMLFYRARRAAGLAGLGRQNLFLPSFAVSFGFGRRLRRDAGRHSRTGCRRKTAPGLPIKTTTSACRRPFLILPLKTAGNHTIVLLCASACSTNRSKNA